jgi:hypothetical protein
MPEVRLTPMFECGTLRHNGNAKRVNEEYSVDLETWIKSSIPSNGEMTAVPVAMASEIADVATRYIKVLDAGDAEAARAELAVLRELCEERMAALGALPKRDKSRSD